MPFKELAFFADVKREVLKTQRHMVTAPNVLAFYQSSCLYIVFENFQIRFILQAKIKVFFINVKVT